MIHYQQERRRIAGGSPKKLKLGKQDFGSYGEFKVYEEMTRAGRAVQLTPYMSAYDLCVDGWNVDVKIANPVPIGKTIH